MRQSRDNWEASEIRGADAVGVCHAPVNIATHWLAAAQFIKARLSND
jgi:hypothetical protein